MNTTLEQLPFSYIAETLVRQDIHAPWEWDTTPGFLYGTHVLQATYPGLVSCKIETSNRTTRLRQKDLTLRVALSRNLTEEQYDTSSRIQVSLAQSVRYKKSLISVWHMLPSGLPARPPEAFTNDTLVEDFTNNIVSILDASVGLHNQIDHRLKSLFALPRGNAFHDNLHRSNRRYQRYDQREFLFANSNMDHIYLSEDSP